MHSKQCRKVCSNSRDMFTTHIEVIVSWWSWKPSSRAPKIEYSFSADPHPRRIISVLCPSMQEGVLRNLPGSETCWAFSIRENTTNKHSYASEGDSGHLCHFCSIRTSCIKNSLPYAALCWELGLWQTRIAVVIFYTMCYAGDNRAPREQLPPQVPTAEFYPAPKGVLSWGFPGWEGDLLS